MKTIQCKNCEHFRMWEGDPCCLEPQEGWKTVLPDMTKECCHFIEADKKYVDWGQIWDAEKKDFFSRIQLKSNMYDAYIKEHPEYVELIKNVD